MLPAEHDLDTGDLVAVAEAGLQCLRKKSVLRWRVGADAGDRGQIDANAAGGATLARLRIPTGLSFAPNSNMTMPRDTVSRMRAARGALGISI